MHELANQFGGKNREIYGESNENAKNDDNFPKFAAKIIIEGDLRPLTIKQFNDSTINN